MNDSSITESSGSTDLSIGNPREISKGNGEDNLEEEDLWFYLLLVYVI